MNIVPSEEENVYFLKAAEILACFYLETYKHTVTKEWYKKTNGGKLSFQAVRPRLSPQSSAGESFCVPAVITPRNFINMATTLFLDLPTYALSGSSV